MTSIVRRLVRPAAGAMLLIVTTTGCFGYRVVRPDEIEIPSYEPREVLIPERCDVLIRRAGTAGTETMSEEQVAMVSFCQNQQLIRAQEEEAVARKLEAHAEAASFALRLTTVVVGSLIAVIAWVL